MFISVFAMQRYLDSFHYALAFYLERWLDEAAINSESPFFQGKRQASQPFLLGLGSCMGQNHAWAEVQLALGKLLWTFDVATPEDRPRDLLFVPKEAEMPYLCRNPALEF